MRHIFVIGNGFDLAHGLPTSYGDFLLWLLKRELIVINNKNASLFFTTRRPFGKDKLEEFLSKKTLKEIIDQAESDNINIKGRFKFVHTIFSNFQKYNWVDIESTYFEQLKFIYKSHQNNGSFNRDFISQVNHLNNVIRNLKLALAEYLKGLELSNVDTNEDIFNHFEMNEIDFEKPKIILNFNYTKTCRLYMNQGDKRFNIHGELNDVEKMIFGYGNEKDPIYENLELENLDEFLINFKSFGYFKTNVYQKFISTLAVGDYTVHLMGHSCGISDKVLLQTIFEKTECKKIVIYYHDTDEYDDHFDKTVAISRHFSPDQKEEMRLKIVSKEDSVPLIWKQNINH